jgi:hypothetical protein
VHFIVLFSLLCLLFWCIVVHACRAFQELLLVHGHTKGSTACNYTANLKSYLVDNKASYNFKYLRPSTLLHYLVSIAPSQLPSPYQQAAGATSVTVGSTNPNLIAYIEQLTTFNGRGPSAVTPVEVLDRFSVSEYTHSKFASPPIYTISTVLKYYPSYFRSFSGSGLFGQYAPPYECWNDNSVEATMVWRVIQQCLDTYMQRIVAVSSAAGAGPVVSAGISSAEYKQSMRNWYELILSMGDVALLSANN